MIFSTVFATLTLAASALAVPNLAARAAPSVIYPRAGTIWAPGYRHNVTWASQSGTGTITMKPSNGNAVTLASNVDLSSGRTEITVPGVAAASGYTVSIASGGETSTSQQFSVGPVDTPPPPATASSAISSATSIASSVASSASSAVSSAASSASSVASSASSAASSASSAASSASSSLESATSSVASSASSAASSLSASVSSALSSLSSAASSAASSLSSHASSAASSAASQTSNAAMHAADLGITRFGVAIGAGLVAVATLSGALIL